jgi:uncharacterized protein (TIGR01777 family)
MDVAISGASGFLGQALVKKMRLLDWNIRIINRADFNLTVEAFCAQNIDGTDAVVNLAGAPVARKWTSQYKQEILNSRVLTTQKIAGSIMCAVKRPSVFISTSAIGIYDQEGTHTESSTRFAGDFLAKVCKEWETAALSCEYATRVSIFRIGLVLGKNGGALEKMHFPFSIGLGGKMGNGRQPVSFIHIKDLVDAIIFAIQNPSLSGIVNAVAPITTTNREFASTLGKALKQPAWLAIPAFALKLVFGEQASILLEGQRVVPEKLQQAGFRFKYPTIQNALVEIYR